MAKRFPESSEQRPVKNAERVSASLEGGEEISVSQEGFTEYMDALRGKNAKDAVKMRVAKWKPLHGTHIPPIVDAYVRKTQKDGETQIDLVAQHPDKLNEDDMRWIFGDVVPQMVGSEAKSDAFDSFLLKRRREVIAKHLDKRLEDPGVRSLCQHVIYSNEEKADEAHSTAKPDEDISVGTHLLHELHRALTNGTAESLRELDGAVHAFRLTWQSATPEEQKKIRHEMATHLR
jgi:hypothetical protein